MPAADGRDGLPASHAAPARIRGAETFPFLDLLRFAAALLVAFGHMRGLFFVGIQSVEQPSFFTKAFYLVTGLQHEAVIVFFVLSGFLVGGGIMKKLADRSFSPRLYIVNRFTRIYVVLIPAILLAAVLTAAGLWLFPETRFYTEQPLFPSGFGSSWTWAQVPCHIAALQGLFCQPFSFDPPLWSLGYEWVLYLLGPILFGILYLRANPIVVVVLLILFVCALLTLKPARVWMEWPLYWFLGAAAARIQLSRPSPAFFGIACLAVFAVALPVSRLHVLPLRVTDLWVALSLALAFTSTAVIRSSIAPETTKYGADFSYSLYAIHLPLAVFVGAALEVLGAPQLLAQPGLTTAALFIVTTAIVLAASYLFAGLTERHTAELRRLITSWWTKPELKPLKSPLADSGVTAGELHAERLRRSAGAGN